MPARSIKHPCKHVYTQQEASDWVAIHRGKAFPHQVQTQCKSAAVEYPKGSGKFEDYCASHLRAQKKCRVHCVAMVTVGSHAVKTKKARLVKRPCKNCPMPGSSYCKLHTSGAVRRVKRAAGPATLRAQRHKGTSRRYGAPVAEIRAFSPIPPPRSGTPIVRMQ